MAVDGQEGDGRWRWCETTTMAERVAASTTDAVARARVERRRAPRGVEVPIQLADGGGCRRRRGPR